VLVHRPASRLAGTAEAAAAAATPLAQQTIAALAGAGFGKLSLCLTVLC